MTGVCEVFSFALFSPSAAGVQGETSERRRRSGSDGDDGLRRVRRADAEDELAKRTSGTRQRRSDIDIAEQFPQVR